MKEINKMLQNMFPSIEDIPKEYRLKEEINQDEYLIDGSIKQW